MPDLSESVEQLTDTLVTEAALPLKSESDGQSAEGHKLTDIIAAAKFAAANGPKTRPTIKLIRIIPPGAV